jgi:hypothetical protein
MWASADLDNPHFHTLLSAYAVCACLAGKMDNYPQSPQ